MSALNVCVLLAPGTNCHQEAAFAVELAGGKPVFVHLNQLRDGSYRLRDFAGLVIPGGFSFGDHIASGLVQAAEMLTRFGDELREFLRLQRPIIGICNGCQVLAQTGIVPLGELGSNQVELAHNVSRKFECRWTAMIVLPSPCVYTRDLVGREIEMPVAHGEGKFAWEAATLARAEELGLVALRYSTDGQPTEHYPENPNGAAGGVAGVCTPDGLVLALMPHPERWCLLAQHPNWRRRELHLVPHGLVFFQNMVAHMRGA